MEHFDTAETEDEADYLEADYLEGDMLAFGFGWNIWTETQTYQHGTLDDCG